MSTPMETNTEELQKILQQVYDLPDAGSGGSEPDLVITGVTYEENPSGNFGFEYGDYGSNVWGPDYVKYDPEKVLTAYEKLLRGEIVSAILVVPSYNLNSWDGPFNSVYQAIRVSASETRDPNCLLVRFDCATHFSSYEGDYSTLEYRFNLDMTNRTASLTAFVWTRTS